MKRSLTSSTIVALVLLVGGAQAQVPAPRAILPGHKATVSCASFSPDGKVLATGSLDGTIRIWDAASGNELFTFSGHRAAIRAVTFAKDGKTLYSGSEDRTVKSWNIGERKESATLLQSDLQVFGLNRLPDCKSLAVALGNWQKKLPGQVKLIDLATGKEVAAFKLFNRDVLGLAVAANGKTLVAIDGIGGLRLWDLTTYMPSGLIGLRSVARCAAFDPDSTTLATGHDDGSIHLWDAVSWEEDTSLTGHKDLVSNVAFSPDGRIIASASKDGTVRLWNADKPKQQAMILKEHGGPVWFAVFSPDGNTLATGGEDHKVWLWDLASLRSQILKSEKPAAAHLSPPKGEGPTRIALVTSEKVESIRTLLTLAEAKLTESKGIDVLDRQTIDKALAEQKLTVTGLVATDQALAIGKLLSAELLAVLETTPGSKQATGLVVYDARRGVKLWDDSLPSRLGPSIQTIVKGIQAARLKHLQNFKDVRTLCILTTRNADLPRSLDTLCDSVGMLLERSMIASPGVAVLERQRLDQVNKERALPTDAGLQQLLSSIVVCELEIGKSETGKGLKATAELSTAKGKLIGQVSAAVADRNAGDLSQALLSKILETLNAVKPSAEGNPSKEARRFGREAEFFLANHDYARALRASEAAHALDSDDLTLRAELARALCDRAIEAIDPGGQNTFGSFYRKVNKDDLHLSIELVTRGLDLFLDVHERMIDQPLRASGNVHVAVGTNSMRSYRDKVRQIPLEQKRDVLPQLKALSANYRRLVELKLERARTAVKDKRTFEEYTGHVSGWLTQFGMPQGDEWADPLPVLSQWLEMSRTFESADSFASYWLLHNLTNQFRYKAKLPPTLYESYRKVWEALEHHPLPQYRLVGKLGRIAADLEHNLTPAEGQRQIHDLVLLAQKEFNTEAAKKSEGLRINLYYVAFDATQLLVNRPGYQDEMTALGDFMLSRNEVINSIAQICVFSFMTRRSVAESRRAIAFAERTLAVLEAPDGRFLCPGATPVQRDLSRNRLKLDLRQMRDRVIRENPELAAPAAQPWDEPIEIVDTRRARNNLLWVFKPLVENGIVYAAVVGDEKQGGKQFVQLLRYDPERGEKSMGKKRAIETGYKRWTDDLPLGTYFGRAACVHDGSYYLATRNRGIIRLTLDGADVEVIDTNAGLPSDWTHSVAGNGTSLYAGLGEPGKEGFLVRYDLTEKKCDILASSRRKEQLSPFDDASPLEVAYLASDAKRDRMIFTAFVKSKYSSCGLWELGTKTGKFKLLQQLTLHLEGGIWGSPVNGDTVVIATSNGTFTFDLAKNAATLLYTGHTIVDCGPGLPTSILRLKERGPLTKLTDGSLGLGAPYLVHEGWFWAARPFTRVSLDGQKRQTLASPRKGDKYFEPGEVLAALGNKRLLVGDWFGLWILPLSDDK